MAMSTMLSRCHLKHGMKAFVSKTSSGRVVVQRDVSAKSAGSLGLPNVNDLARLSHLDISDKEIADWKPKIGSIVEWMGQLQKVNVTNVPPAIHGINQQTPLRPDVAVSYEARSQLLSNVPEVEGTYVKVPKIATAADTQTQVLQSVAGPATDAAAAPPPDAPSSTPSEPPPSGSSGPTPEELLALQALDIRVGVIIACELHPDADGLYVEAIDVGDEAPRTIVSGLRKYVALEEMQNRRVLVLCNLKPRNMRGIKSAGMLLAASDAAHENVEPVSPPEGAAVGERVWFGELKDQPKAAEPNQVQKKKFWETAGPGLQTDGERVANWKGMTMNTSAGPVTATTLANATIA